MNAERLLENYERGVDAIARRRCFILDFAMQGWLVAREPNNESAPDPLKRIAVTKARAGKGRKATKYTATSVRRDEKPFSIPKSWFWVRFVNIANFSARRT
jgi:hypothetical protein